MLRNKLCSKDRGCTNRKNSRADHQRSVPWQPHSVRQYGVFPIFYAKAAIEERMAPVQQEHGKIADNSSGEERAYQEGYNSSANAQI